MATPAEILNLGFADGKNKFNVGVGGSSAMVDHDLDEIENGYAESPRFTVVGTKCQFRVRVDAATTGNSNYPRSELRELGRNGVDKAEWKISSSSGVHYMEGRSAADHLPPDKPWVVVSQIHDANSDLCRLQTEGSSTSALKLVVRYTPTLGGAEQKVTVQASYTLGAEIAWKWYVQNTTVQLLLSGSVVLEFQTSRASGCYFKAGAYSQSNETTESDPSEYPNVLLWDFRHWHTGWPLPSTTGGVGGGTVTPLGKTSDGASASASTADKTAVSSVVATSSGTVTAGHARLWLSAAGSATTKCVVYADSGGLPGAKLAESDAVTLTSTTEDRVDYAFTGANQIAISSGTTYWVGAAWLDPGTISINYSRDITAAGRQETASYAPGSFGTATALAGPIDAYVDVTSAGSPAAAPIVDAGIDAAVNAGTLFTRNASDDANGSPITARTWKIQAGPSGVGTTIGTDAQLAWWADVVGTWTLRYSATNSAGTSNDDIVVTVSTASTGGGGDDGGDGGGAVTQTLGVGGIPRPAAGPNVVLISANSSSTLNITTPNVIVDGGGFTVPKINIAASGVTVQNFYVRGGTNSGIYSFGKNNIIQNNDIAQIVSDGDVNGVSFFGDGHQILFNRIGDSDFLLSGPPLGSHTDGIQCWNTLSKQASSGVRIAFNRIVGPPQSDPRYLHQGVTAEGNNATSGGGGGTGDSTSWVIEGNYFLTYGNQVLELRDIQGVVVTRNVFAGGALKIVNSAEGSTVSYYSDNVVTGTTANVGVPTIAGPGPGGGGAGGGASGPIYALAFPDGVAYPVPGSTSSVVNVSSSAALTSALSAAEPGQEIRLASGTYSGTFTLSGKKGSASAGIAITSTSGATFASGSKLVIKDSTHVTVSGLTFPFDAAGDTIQFRGSSSTCRFTRCTVGPTTLTSSTNAGNMIYVADDCELIRIDHNELRNKGTSGNAIRVYGNFDTFAGCKHVRIDHNLIRDIGPEVGNDKEAIRYGVSTMSRTMAYGAIERNVFVNVKAEPEVISGKMGGHRISGNVLLRCAGGLVARHGTSYLITDNYIVDRAGTTASAGLTSGGLRFYDRDHYVGFNYVDSVVSTSSFQDPLLLDSGDAEGSSTALANHWRVVAAEVERNVIVGCRFGITVGHNYSSAPSGCTIADNLVVGATSGAAITQRITLVGSTVGANPFYVTTAAAGMTQDADGIWRKTGYGPRLGYLAAADVGVTGDTGDFDGTGGGTTGGGGGGGAAPGVSAGADAVLTPGGTFTRTAVETALTGITSRSWTIVSAPAAAVQPDNTQAAVRYGWGTPLSTSDEFTVAGAPSATKWSRYDGEGHGGNGTRNPARISVDGSKLVIRGLADGSTGGMAHRHEQQYGKWEVRLRSRNVGSSGSQYHPVAIIWPTDPANWPTKGEYDFAEWSRPGDTKAQAFIHYPHDTGQPVQQVNFQKPGIDCTQYHNYAIEWTPTAVRVYCDGELYGEASGGANSIRRDIQTMPSGHLTLQLDGFDGDSGYREAVMEVEWARVYPPTPAGTAPPDGVPLAGTTVSTAADVAWSPPPVEGDYVLRYTAAAAEGPFSDEVTVRVAAAGGGTPPSFVAATVGESGTGASVEVSAPPGSADGMFQLAVLAFAGDETVTAVPSGWRILDTITVVSPDGDRGGPSRASLYYSTTAASASATWAKSGARFWYAARAAWSGQSTLGQHLALAETGGSTAHPTPPVTPAQPNSLVVGVAVTDLLVAAGGPFSPPTGWSERYDRTVLSGRENESIAIADKVVTTPVATTGTFTGTNVDEAATFAFVLEGIATAGPGPAGSAGPDATIALGQSFTRTATETGTGIVARRWQVVSGPAQVNATLSTSAAVSWTPTVAGTYVLRYSAGTGSSTASDDVTVTVLPAGSGGGIRRRQGFLLLFG